MNKTDAALLRKTCGSCGNTAVCSQCHHDMSEHARQGPGNYDCRQCPCKGAKLGL